MSIMLNERRRRGLGDAITCRSEQRVNIGGQAEAKEW